MLQSHICVSPRLPPSPPPLPSLMPREETAPGKRGARLEPALGDPGGPHWGVAPPRQGWRGHRWGSGGCTAPVTRHGAQGGCRLCQHHVAAVPAARLDPGNIGGFPCQEPRRGEERLRSTRQEASPSRNSLHTPPCSLGCPQPGPSVPKPSSK